MTKQYRSAYWWGEQPGYVYYEDKKVPILRPRVRSKEGKEVKLESYKAFQSSEKAERISLGDILSGLSIRRRCKNLLKEILRDWT